MAALPSLPPHVQQLGLALRKRLSTAEAKAALVGMVLTTVEGDNGLPLYVTTVDRWALTRSFADIDEVEVWLVRVAGKAAA